MLQPSVKYNLYYSHSNEKNPVTQIQKAWKRNDFSADLLFQLVIIYINTSIMFEKFILLK